MFTQCSKCETIFKVSAEVLRSAGGQVRCGRCGEVFDALARLAEQPTQFNVGESPLELETRADHILQSKPSPLAPASAPASAPTHDEFELGESLAESLAESHDIEVARLEIQDGLDFDLSGDDPALEFTLPPGELDRIFIDPQFTKTTALPKPGEHAAEGEPPDRGVSAGVAAHADAAPDSDTPSRRDLSSQTETLAPADPGSRAHVAALLEAAVTAHGDHTPREHVSLHPDAPSYGQTTPHEHAAPHSDAMLHADTTAHGDARSHGDTTAHADSTPYGDTASYEDATLYGDAIAHADAMPRRSATTRADAHALRAAIVRGPAADSPREWRVMWIVLGAMLVMLLALQLVHQNRAWLAANTALAGPLRFVYEKLGAPIPVPLNLSAYQLRQFGVTGDPDANGALRVRASILNSAADIEPYPLLRVTLADRFGNRIGGRDFEPAEYLGRPVARLLAPGERIDATLNILDPGKDAEGFEIDVCLRGPERTITCANDAAQRPK